MSPHIFIYWGKCPYLEYSIKQSVKSGNEVILIADEECLGSIKNCENVDFQYYNIHIWNEIVENFRAIYVHRSSHPYNFEFYAFARWLVLLEFCRANHISSFFYSDADVMFYSTVDKELNKIIDSGIATKDCNGILLAHSLFSLSLYKDILWAAFTDEKSDSSRHITWCWEEINKAKLNYGICDMTFWSYMQDKYPGFASMYLTKDINNEVYDWHIGVTDGYQIEAGIKKVVIEDGLPYFVKSDGAKIRAVTIHFSGPNRPLMKLMKEYLVQE